jgi:hypothetical protein
MRFRDVYNYFGVSEWHVKQAPQFKSASGRSRSRSAVVDDMRTVIGNIIRLYF